MLRAPPLQQQQQQQQHNWEFAVCLSRGVLPQTTQPSNIHTQCTKSSRALFSLTNVTGSGNICRKTSFYPSTFLLVGLKLCQVSYFWSFLCVCVCNGQLSETLLFMWCTCTREETKSASEQVRNTP